MSRSKKLRDRLFSLPKYFTWDELVTLMKQYGFNTLNGSGSRRKFINENKRIVALHCPHPGNIVKAYVLKEVKILLEELEAHE